MLWTRVCFPISENVYLQMFALNYVIFFIVCLCLIHEKLDCSFAVRRPYFAQLFLCKEEWIGTLANKKPLMLLHVHK